VQNLIARPERNGTEVEIIDGFAPRSGRAIGSNEWWENRPCYKVLHADGDVSLVEPHKLRKKRPPREDLKVTTWDECPWQPEEVQV
jgi:hypothetical protein